MSRSSLQPQSPALGEPPKGQKHWDLPHGLAVSGMGSYSAGSPDLYQPFALSCIVLGFLICLGSVLLEALPKQRGVVNKSE